MIGKEYDYICAVIELILQEALLADDRVDAVTVNNIELVSKSSMSLEVTVETFWGSFNLETEAVI